MLEVDGSFGEGGGQIIRTAIALAAITGKEVDITNIRANRPNPGLSAQHLNAVKAVERLSSGRTEGLELRSTRLKFSPGPELGPGHTKPPGGFEGEIEIGIGTAGSITLLLQALIPVALFSRNETKVRIIGGTDVKWSPPIDFYRHLFIKALREMGCEIYLKTEQRGYYPKGGGLVEISLIPVDHLRGFLLLSSEAARESIVKGVSHSSGLPRHVAERQARAAEKVLRDNGYEAAIEVEFVAENGAKWRRGSGITLWCGYKSGSALGERGKRAEFVGEEAARMILKELESASTVDLHLADQLVPYLALSNEKSEMIVRKMTKHLETNLYITQRFLNARFEIEKMDGREEKEAGFVITRNIQI